MTEDLLQRELRCVDVLELYTIEREVYRREMSVNGLVEQRTLRLKKLYEFLLLAQVLLAMQLNKQKLLLLIV